MKLSIYNILVLCVICILTISNQADAQIRKEKKIEKAIAMNPNGSITINHLRGPLTIKRSSSNEARIESIVTVIGKYEGDVDLALELCEVEIEELTNSVEVKVIRNIVKWQSINRKSTIIFTNGDKVDGIREIVVKTVAYLPDLKRISLSNRYDDIIFDDIHAEQVTIDLHDGKVNGQDINGNLVFNTKYSDGQIGNVTGTMDLDVYDSDVNFGASASIQGKFKYSDCSFGETGKINLDSHDSEIKMANVNGASYIKDKYSEINLGNCPELTLEVHDSDFQIGDCDKLDVVSKYSELVGGNIANIKIDSHDDKFKFSTINNLNVKSKYTEYDIETLTSSLHMEVHDDNFEVNDFGASFSSASIVGKYIDVNLTLNSSASLELVADAKYGSIEYDEDRANTTLYKDKNSTIEIRATFGDPQGKKFKIDCHDCKIDLN